MCTPTESGWRAEIHHQSRRYAKPVVLDDIAIGDTVLVCHQIEPQSRPLAEFGERLIDVCCGPFGRIRAEHQGAVRERT
jgi:hypothetical protein